MKRQDRDELEEIPQPYSATSALFLLVLIIIMTIGITYLLLAVILLVPWPVYSRQPHERLL